MMRKRRIVLVRRRRRIRDLSRVSPIVRFRG